MAAVEMLHTLALRARRAVLFKPRRAGPNAKPVFFLHIPKCAGSSLWHVIYDIYGTRNVYLATSKPQLMRLEAMPMEKRQRYSGIGGHGPLSFFRGVLGDMTRYHKIVTLRDPVDRVISEYNFIRERPQHRLYRTVSAQSFEDFIETTAQPNRQVKLLTGRADDSEGALEVVSRFFDDWALSDDIGRMAERLYQVAETAPRPVARKNVGTSSFRRTDLDAATLRLLEEANRHDLALIDGLRQSRGQ